MNKKKHLLFIGLLFFGSISLCAETKSETLSSIRHLIDRVLPYSNSHFLLEIIPPDHGKDVAEVDKEKQLIVLRANNANSLAYAFNIYLSEVAQLSYSWEAEAPLKLPHPLILPAFKIKRVCSASERFFNNTCTFGYTYPYWNWTHWQRFIDWMAMNGINRPLMQAGQEAVWWRVWKSFGMTSSQICSYFSAPAHLPWHRMGNMDSWGGPLPLSYINAQEKLQKRIVARCRSLGMEPVLSAFAGHVPAALKSLYPHVKIETIKPGWGGMDTAYSTHFLDPHEPLFAEIQQRFLTTQRTLYGTNHLYSADPFNEMEPPSWDPLFLSTVSKAIYQSMSKADPQSVWYQMSWTLSIDQEHWTQDRLKAMVKEVPPGKLVFLDYVCEEQEYFRGSNNFQGAPFVWCYLGNFGGNTHLVAPLNKVMTRLKKLREIQSCVGVGSTLEGINANPVVYELVLQAPWLSVDEMDITHWIRKYADRRSGGEDRAVREAWKLLVDKVLVDSAIGIGNHCSIYQVCPVVDLKKRFWTTNPDIPYRNVDLLQAVATLLQAQPKSTEADAYQFDLVNLTRQLLSNYGLLLYNRMIESYQHKDAVMFHLESQKFLRLGLQIDSLLETRSEFLLGKWLACAAESGNTSSEKSYYLRDAREIITTWHQGGGGLTDYANRQWNGLLRSYYLPRWSEFVSRLEHSLQSHTPFDENDFRQWCIHFEQQWVDCNDTPFPTQVQASAVHFATKLFQQYQPSIAQSD